MSPIDIILVRHGESEANLAKSVALNNNDDKLYDNLKKKKSTAFYKLSDLGKEQIEVTGNWIKQNINTKIDYYYTSEYIRALETSYYLNLPDAQWKPHVYLREKDNGTLSGMSPIYKTEHHQNEIDRKNNSLFFYAAPGGESVVNCCQRVDLFLKELNENCKDKTVIVVCHGGLMNAFRIVLESIMTTDFEKINRMKNGSEQIENGHILWYSRRDPNSNDLGTRFNWLYKVCPWKEKYSDIEKNKWLILNEKTYSNIELYKLIKNISNYINF